ncbi:MAG: hypothetical protein ABIC18_05485, partial [Candidatus Omnitrophota bacterium]
DLTNLATEIEQINNQISEIIQKIQELTKEKQLPKTTELTEAQNELLQEKENLVEQATQLREEQLSRADEFLKTTDSEHQKTLTESAARIEQANNQIAEIDQKLQGLAEEKQLPEIKKLAEERRELLQKEEELAKQMEQSQEQRAALEQEYQKTTQEKESASKKEPENKNLLEKLEAKIETIKKDLEIKLNNTQIIEKSESQTEAQLDEIRATAYRESIKTEPEIPKNWIAKEVFEQKLKDLKELLREAQAQYLSVKNKLAAEIEKLKTEKQKPEELAKKKEVKKEIEKTKPQERFSLLDILSRALIMALFLVMSLLIYWIIAFFLPYFREKNKLEKALLQKKHNLAIILLHTLLCRILHMFGYKYPVTIDPVEHLNNASRAFKSLQSDYRQISDIFLEARYSSHNILEKQVENAISSYKNIIGELKKKGSSWQKLVLRFNFVFGIQEEHPH